MMKIYEEPKCSIIFFRREDVITASGNGEGLVSDRTWEENPWETGFAGGNKQ